MLKVYIRYYCKAHIMEEKRLQAKSLSFSRGQIRILTESGSSLQIPLNKLTDMDILPIPSSIQDVETFVSLE